MAAIQEGCTVYAILNQSSCFDACPSHSIEQAGKSTSEVTKLPVVEVMVSKSCLSCANACLNVLLAACSSFTVACEKKIACQVLIRDSRMLRHEMKQLAVYCSSDTLLQVAAAVIIEI